MNQQAKQEGNSHQRIGYLNEFALGSVTFEPGVRTVWHTHPKGQVEANTQ